MERNSIRVATIFGIPIRVHLSWLFIFLLVTLVLATGYFPSEYPHWPYAAYWATGLATSLLFFVSVLLHELAHSVVAVWRGMRVRDIVLFVFGGVSQIAEEPASAGTEFLMTLVGPLTSFIIGFGALALVGLGGIRNQYLGAMVLYLGRINIMLGVFNLIPGFPLDGGRLLRAAIWAVTRDLWKATRWATRMGVLVSYAFILFGAWLILTGNWTSGLWMALIGWFLNNAANASFHRMVLKQSLKGHAVRDIMSLDCPAVSGPLNVADLVRDYVLARGDRCVPVVDGDRVVGIVTLHTIKGVPPERWPETDVSQVLIPMERVKWVGPDEELWAAFQEMTEEGVNQLPVIQDGRLVGLIRRDMLMGFLRARAELGV